MPRRLRHANSFLAQVLASSTSVILTIAAALALAPDELGVLAVAMALQALGMGLVRALAAEPVIFSVDSYGTNARALVGPSTTAATLYSLALGAFTSLVGALLGFAGLAAALAICLVTTVLQDHLRTLFLVHRRGGMALLTDGAGLAFLLMALPWANQAAQPASFLIAWSAGSVGAVVIGCAVLRPALRPSSVGPWLRDNARHGSLYSLDFAVTTGLSQMSVIAVAVIVGPTGAAALRGAQVLLTPVSLVLRAGIAIAAPEIVRRVTTGDLKGASGLGVSFSLASGVAAASCLLWLAVPHEWVRLFLGDSSELALGAVLAAAFAWGATGTAIGPGLYLRATGRLALATRIKVWVAPLSTAALLVGATVGGAAGSQIGLALGECLRAVVAWRFVAQQTR